MTSQRTRSRYFETPVTCPEDEHRIWYSDGTTSLLNTHEAVDVVSYSVDEIMIDHVTPNYKKRSAQGEIINMPMEKTIVTVDDPICAYVSYFEGVDGNRTFQQRDSYSRPISYFLAASPVKDITLPSVDKEALISKALTSARSGASLTEAQSLASLGEMKETVSSIGSIMYRFYKIYRAVRKADLKYLRKQISKSELADRYMELRYAIRPLVFDVQQHVDALRSDSNIIGSRQTFRGYESDSVFERQTVHLSHDWACESDFHISKSYSVSVRAGELYQLTQSWEGLKFGLADLPQTAWELTPFSFIIDWFLNLGDVISALSPKPGLRRLASWYVVEETTTLQMHRESQPRIEGQYTSGYINTPGVLTKTTVKKERVANPTLDYHVHFDVNLNAFKLLDLSIILGKLRKARR